MASRQTISLSPELLLAVDRSLGGVRQQVEQRLREGIRSGALVPGARLPSTRALAGDLGVARSTVTDAYEQLVAEGYLIARVGAGTVVAGPAVVAPSGAPRPAFVPGTPAPAGVRFDLRPGGPDLQQFPRALVQRAFRTALAELPDAELDYGDARGLPRLRTALAEYLGRVRGVATGPDDVVVTNGFGSAFSLLLDCEAWPGGPLAVEDPGQAAVRETLLAGRAVDLVPVPVDDSGLQVDALEPSRARAVLVTPAHQYPTGAVLGPERRASLVEWARERAALIVEDDYDSEFRYDREPIGALQGLAPERVVHCGSVSKTLAPGMRMGWAVAPPSVAEALAERRMRTDHGAPPILQAAFAVLLERGDYDRHLRRMRALYRRRRDALIAALALELPGARVSGAAAGLHLVLSLPDGVDEAAVVAAAAARGVAVLPMAPSYVAATGPPALVVGYGRVADAAVERAARELAAAVGDARPRRGS